MSNVKSAQVVNLGESGSWRVGNSHREFFSGIYPGSGPVREGPPLISHFSAPRFPCGLSSQVLSLCMTL